MEIVATTGRRKTSVARAFLKEGNGSFFVNKKKIESYFPTMELLYKVQKPLKALNLEKKYDIKVTVSGGGKTGQADAVTLAVARAFVKIDPEHRNDLKQEGLLTRDPRVVERKKYGQKKARKKFQFSKR